MVTPTQIKQQITQREQQFQQARQQLAQVKTRIAISQRQLLQQRGIASREKIRQVEAQRRKQIVQAKQQLSKQEQTFKKQVSPVQKQIKAYESAVAAQQSEATEWARAEQLIRSGRAFEHVPGSVRRKIEDLQAGGLVARETQVRRTQELFKVQQEIEAQIQKLDLQQLQVPEISEFERLISAPGVLEEAMGRTIEGVPLVSTPKGVIPEYEVPKFEAPETLERRLFFEKFEEFKPKEITPIPTLDFLKISERERTARERAAREAEAIKRLGVTIVEKVPEAIKKVKKVAPIIPFAITLPGITIPPEKVIEKVVPFVEKAVKVGVPAIEKVKPLIGIDPQITVKDIGIGVKIVAPVVKGAVGEILERDKMFYEDLKENLIEPVMEAHARREDVEFPTLEKSLPFFQKQIKEKDLSLTMVETIKKAKEQEEKLEQEAKIVLRQIDDINQETDFEKQQVAIKRLEGKGVKFKETIDQDTGKTVLTISTPIWFENLRPGFEKKRTKETFKDFFMRKLKRGIGETYADIYQRVVFKGPTIFEPSKPRAISPEAVKFGKGVAVGAEVAAFAVPGVREYMFFAGPTEALTRGIRGAVEYAKEEPLEVGIAALGVGVVAFKGVQFLRAPKPIVIKPSVVTAKAVQVAEVKPFVSKTEFLMKVKRGEAIYAVQPRWQRALKIAPKPKQLITIKPQEYLLFTPGMEPQKIIKGFGLRKQPITTLGGRLVPTKRFGEPVIVRLRKGARQLTFYRLKGRGQAITKSAWTSLTKTQKKALEGAARKSGWTGEGKLYDFLRGKEVSVGGVEARKFLKIRRTKAVEPVGLQVKFKKGVPEVHFYKKRGLVSGITVKDIPPGRTITRADIISVMERKQFMKSLEAEEALGEVGAAYFKGATAATDVTFPAVSRRAKPFIIKEEAFIKGRIGIKEFAPLKKKIGVIEKPKEVIFELAPSEVVKPPVTIKKIISKFPKPPISKKAQVFLVPGVKGEVAVLSPGQAVSTAADRAAISAVERAALKTIPIARAPPTTKLLEVPKEAVIPFVGIKEEIKPEIKVEVKPAVRIIPTLKPALKPVLKPALKPALKPVLKPALKPHTKPLRVSIPKLIVPFFIPEDDFVKRRRLTKKPRPKKRVYTAEIRRRDKWFSVGTFKKLKRAAAVGKKRALETAAASVRIKADGKIIPLKSSRLFRQAKKEPGVIVQKKTKRIRTLGEKKEISLIGARAAKAKRVKKKTKKPKKVKRKTKKKTKKGGRKTKIPFT